MKKRSLKQLIAALAVVTCITAGLPASAAEAASLDAVTAVETVEDSSNVVTVDADTEETAQESEISDDAEETGEVITEEPSEDAGETEDASGTEVAGDTEDSEENSDDAQEEVESYASVIYRGHVQNIGWQGEVKDGDLAGTSGQSLRVEGIMIHVDSNIEGGITYRTHVQNIGWQSWVSDGALAGTTGQSYRLEAIEIKLTGELAEQYDVYYRAHVQNIGWMGWAKNGESAGSEGYSFRMEAVQIKLVKKGETDSAISGSAAAYSKLSVSYSSHVQNVGWQNAVSNGATSGTSGQSLRLEGMKINLSSYWGNQISYRTHVQNIGWQNWVSSGALAGTTGQSLRLEAIQIKLTGTMASLFDIYYRVHAQNIGWMGWAKNGESAGTEGYSYRLEAIQIRLVPKGSAAPGSTSDAYRKYVAPAFNLSANNTSAYNTNAANPQLYASSTRYLILVNNSARTTTVYTGSMGKWTVLRSMSCCVGKASTPTVRGVYYVGGKGRYFNTGTNARCWYYTQFYGNYLFHSVIYDRQSSPVRILDGTMGAAVSHGCVRLTLTNAKWIYDNIPANTKVVSF